MYEEGDEYEEEVNDRPLAVRWIVDGEFQFTPGVDLTDVSQVKKIPHY